MPDKREQAVDSGFIDERRRRFVQTVVGGSLAGLAGCMGGDDDNGNEGPETEPGTQTDVRTPDTGLPDVDREFVIATGVPGGATPSNAAGFNSFGFQNFRPARVGQLGFDVTRIGNVTEAEWKWGYLAEDPEITDTEFSFRIKETGWSNGEPVLAADAALRQGLRRHFYQRPTPDIREEGPQSAQEAWTDLYIGDTHYLDVDWSDPDGVPNAKRVRFVSEEGYIGEFPDWQIQGGLGGNPGHVDRWNFAPIMEELGNIPQPYEMTGTDLWDRLQNIKVVGVDGTTVEDVHCHGVFNLVNITEQDYVFEVNEHHRNADAINFNGARARVLQDQQSRFAAFNARSLDGSPGLGAPANVVNSFPEEIKQYLSDDWSGFGIQMNGGNEHLGNPRVRQALHFAIDDEAVAGNLHQYAQKTYEYPGTFRVAEKYFSGEELDSLYTYEKDDEKAAALLETAGYSQEGGDWVDPDGNPLEFGFMTTSDDPVLESTVQSQLGNFGVGVSIDNIDDATYTERAQSGQFDMRTANWEGPPWWNTLDFLRMIRWGDQRGDYGFFTDADAQRIADEKEGVSVGAEGHIRGEPTNPDTYRDVGITIQAPPVGEPDGDLQEWEAAALAAATVLGGERTDENLKQLYWLHNWFQPRVILTQAQTQAFLDRGKWTEPVGEDKLTGNVGWGIWTDITPHLQQGLIQANPDE